MTEHILELADEQKEEKIRALLRQQPPVQRDCVATVNPIRFGALGTGSPSLSDWKRVLGGLGERDGEGR